MSPSNEGDIRGVTGNPHQVLIQQRIPPSSPPLEKGGRSESNALLQGLTIFSQLQGPFDSSCSVRNARHFTIVTQPGKISAKPLAHWILWIALLSSIAVISLSKANPILTANRTFKPNVPIPKVEIVDFAAKAGLT